MEATGKILMYLISSRRKLNLTIGHQGKQKSEQIFQLER